MAGLTSILLEDGKMSLTMDRAGRVRNQLTVDYVWILAGRAVSPE